MSTHERFLLLAAAAIDFPLSVAEADELAAHLRACAQCRQAAGRLRVDAEGIAALPIRRPSDAVRQRITEATQAPRPITYRRTLAWVVVALLLATAIVGGALAGAALLRGTDPLERLALPLPTTAVATERQPPVTDGPSPAPATALAQRAFETDCGTVTPDASLASVQPVLRPDTTAAVLVDGLRIRSAPRIDDCSKLLTPLLQGSEQVFVIAGPVVHSGYDWYRVEPVGGLGEARPSGWVARASRDGTMWVAPAERSCPTIDLTPSTLVMLNLGFILACLGDRELQFEAHVGPCRCPAEAGGQRIVGFTADLQAESLVGLIDPLDPDATLPASLGAGASAIDPLTPEAVATIVGHYDDPTSGTCTWSASGPGATPSPDPVLTCRATFVVTDISP